MKTIDTEKLYSIALVLKTSKQEIESYTKILEKNTSSSIRSRLDNSKKTYDNAVNEFNQFVNEYKAQ